MAKVKIYPAEGFGAHIRSVEGLSVKVDEIETNVSAATAVSANASDLATAIVLVNELKAILIAAGLAS